MSEDIRIKIIANTEPYYVKIQRLTAEFRARITAQECSICEAEKVEIIRFELIDL